MSCRRAEREARESALAALLGEVPSDALRDVASEVPEGGDDDGRRSDGPMGDGAGRVLH